MPPKLQLLAVVAFAVAMLFLENQIQKLEESRSKLGEEQKPLRAERAVWAGGRAREALQPEQAGVRGLVWRPEAEKACGESWGRREHKLPE